MQYNPPAEFPRSAFCLYVIFDNYSYGWLAVNKGIADKQHEFNKWKKTVKEYQPGDDLIPFDTEYSKNVLVVRDEDEILINLSDIGIDAEVNVHRRARSAGRSTRPARSGRAVGHAHCVGRAAGVGL